MQNQLFRNPNPPLRRPTPSQPPPEEYDVSESEDEEVSLIFVFDSLFRQLIVGLEQMTKMTGDQGKRKKQNNNKEQRHY